MTVQELRIGNYVNVLKDGQSPFRIDLFDYVSKGIGKFGQIDNHKLHPTTWYLQDLQPIPLTEEWLLKFGFKRRKYENSYWFEKSKNKLLFLSNDINPNKGCAYSTKLDHIFLHDGPSNIKKVKYVHQLQNLYFALTGNELKLINK
jgi:hypothetical protein